MADPRRERNSYLACLTNRDFLLFYSGQYISFIGDRLAQLAFMLLLGIEIGLHAQNDPETADRVNLLFVFSIIPYIFMFPLSGFLIDRFRRRNVMIVCTCLQGVVAIGAAEMIRAQGFDHVADSFIYLAVLLIYINSAVFNPAKYALIPEIVEEKHLLAANALNTSTATISTLLGTFLGGWMLTALNRVTGDDTSGVVWALYLDSLTFFLPGLLLLFVVRDLRRRPQRSRVAHSAKRQMVEGFHYLWRHTVVRRLMSLVMLIWFIAGFYFASINVLVLDVRNENMGTYTIWMGTIGLGVFSGALTTGLTCRHVSPRRVTGTALTALGLLLLLSSVALRLERAQMAFLFVTAMGAGAVIVTIDTLMQRIVPNAIRGRMFAIVFLLSNIALATAFGLNILLRGQDVGNLLAQMLPGVVVVESAYFQLLSLPALVGGALIWRLGRSPVYEAIIRKRGRCGPVQKSS